MPGPFDEDLKAAPSEIEMDGLGAEPEAVLPEDGRVYGEDQGRFTPDFQRKILHVAVTTPLISDSAGAFKARYFGPRDGGNAHTPSQMIAEVLERFCRDHPGEFPGIVTMDVLVHELGATLKPLTREDVQKHWEEVKATAVPDPSYVKEQVCRWAQTEALHHAVTRSAKMLQDHGGRSEGWEKLGPAILERVAQAVRVGQPASTTDQFCPADAPTLLAEPDEGMTWLWEPFIPIGSLVALVSYPKVGKSTFAYPLALALARGHPFLSYPTIKGPVLILALEERREDVNHRLRRLGLRPEDPIYVHRGSMKNTPEALAAIRAFITTHGIMAVFVDTLPKFWSLDEESDNSELIRQCEPFLALARDTGAAVVLLHHERKSGGDEGREIRGGSALLGLVDQALLLKRRHGGPRNHRVLESIGRYDQTPEQLVIAKVDEEFRSLGAPDKVAKDDLEKQVWDALWPEEKEGRTIEQVMEVTGLSERKVRRATENMGTRIKRTGRGAKGSPHLFWRRGQ